jgi:hypothetical protein
MITFDLIKKTQPERPHKNRLQLPDLYLVPDQHSIYALAFQRQYEYGKKDPNTFVTVLHLNSNNLFHHIVF